jgi:predicted ATP-grasp superfamily ATP-dependent carboligase
MPRLKPAYPWNVLVFPAASEIGLEIHRALADCKEVNLVAANLAGPSLADFHYRTVHALPSVHEAAFLPQLQALLTHCAIDTIFPAHDDVLAALAELGDALLVPVIAAPPAACRICRSKKLTYAALAGQVPIPQLFDPAQDTLPWPVFVKPDKGQGSQRARRIDNAAQLTAALAAEPDLIVQELLPGAEYTVDCFSTREQGVLLAAPRIRRQAKSGIAVLTEPAELPEAKIFAARIHAALGLTGAWFFQLKADAAGELRLLEVAPRIAGSMALSRALGPNLPLLSLYAAAGHRVQLDVFPGAVTLGRSLDVTFLDRRPFGALYLDLDDTLLVRGQVNTGMVALVYNCHNRGIPVTLLTRHRGDLAATLARHRLQGLFSRIVHLTDAAEPKAAHITEPDAVLVDDSFRERRLAVERCGIRAYDAAGAICLIDDRR